MANEKSSTDLVARATSLQAMLEKYKGQIERALPEQIRVDRFARIAFSTAQKNPKLLLADQKSFISALIQSAQLGLTVDDIRGHAYLVPYWDSKKGAYTVQFIPGYKGLMELADRSGRIGTFFVEIVYENEVHAYMGGSEPDIKHVPLPPSERGEKKVAVYAVVTLNGGGKRMVWMWMEDVMKIRDKSASYAAYKAKKVSSCIWVEQEEIMIKKTAIRQLAKYIPQSPELQRATMLEEKAEAGQLEREFVFDDEDYSDMMLGSGDTAKEKTDEKVEGLKEKLNGQTT
jgi:recombination protein RecT